MKFYSILLLTLLVYIYAAEEEEKQYDLKCESSGTPLPSNGKDCNMRQVNSGYICCYMKGIFHDNYYIVDVDGCTLIPKMNIKDDAFNYYMADLKHSGYEVSLDCISSYLSVSLLLLLFIFI